MDEHEFAKLFKSECGRQILVTREDNDDGDAAIKISVHVGGNLAVCSINLVFNNGDDCEQKRDKVFEAFDEKRARTVFDEIINSTIGFN